MTIRTSIFMSLDNRTDAEGEWQYPWFDEEFFSVISAEWDSANALLIGGRSFSGYERLAAEHPESPLVGLLSAKPIVVASRTRTSSELYPDAAFVADLEPEAIGHVEGEFGEVLVLGARRVSSR